jgi:diguanylate cyclase (GGDEF)-like protein
LLSQILDAATSAVPVAEKGTLYLIARDTGQLELRASVGYSDPRIKQLSMSEFRGYVKKTVREKRPLIIHDTYSELSFPPVSAIPEISAIRSAIVAPLILKDRVLGALALESPERVAFNEGDLRLLVSFAATATNAIQNAHLHSEVQQLAVTDPLTGLYNRRGFFELGEREVARAHRYGRPLAAIMMDIDLFKQVNDSYGHSIGDQVLRNVANLSVNNLRKIDILGRYGGDEFAVLLPESDLDAALKVAERIRKSQENFLMPIGHHLVRVTVSLGIANGTRAVGNLESILKRADMAMYSAKQTGRNRVEAL